MEDLNAKNKEEESNKEEGVNKEGEDNKEEDLSKAGDSKQGVKGPIQ
jgi:hypothetical protein